ncbi:CYTH domain-containing protein [Streptococcus sp. SGI.013]|uniref:CYTH domain-containing protein n=1 Tax=unclassified Streptococcus TaxID=2608887 RepID=UPI003D04A6F8
MKQLEIEYKTLLHPIEYQNLLKLFTTEPVTQTNYYFDTPNFDMKKNKLSLRIRTFKTEAELTLKIPQKVGNIEHNLPLSLEEAHHIITSETFPINDITKLIQTYPITLSDLGLLGHLTTKRYEEQTPIGLMALDKNHYADQVDFELELEVSDADKGKEDFENFLQEHQIKFKYAKSKVARFSATLNR